MQMKFNKGNHLVRT